MKSVYPWALSFLLGLIWIHSSFGAAYSRSAFEAKAIDYNPDGTPTIQESQSKIFLKLKVKREAGSCF